MDIYVQQDLLLQLDLTLKSALKEVTVLLELKQHVLQVPSILKLLPLPLLTAYLVIKGSTVQTQSLQKLHAQLVTLVLRVSHQVLEK